MSQYSTHYNGLPDALIKTILSYYTFKVDTSSSRYEDEDFGFIEKYFSAWEFIDDGINSWWNRSNKCLENAEFIDMYAGQISEKEFNILSKLPNIQHLNLSGCYFHSPYECEGAFTSVKHLNLNGVEVGKSSTVEKSILINSLLSKERFNSVNSLKLGFCPITEDALERMSLLNLKSLQLQKCMFWGRNLEATDEYYMPFLFESLQVLDLQLSSEFVEILLYNMKNIPNVRVLNISGTSCSDYIKLFDGLTKLSNLEELDMSNHKLIDPCLQKISTLKLKVLKLNRCRLLTVEGIMYLKEMSSLQQLDLCMFNGDRNYVKGILSKVKLNFD